MKAVLLWMYLQLKGFMHTWIACDPFSVGYYLLIMTLGTLLLL